MRDVVWRGLKLNATPNQTISWHGQPIYFKSDKCRLIVKRKLVISVQCKCKNNDFLKSQNLFDLYCLWSLTDSSTPYCMPLLELMLLCWESLVMFHFHIWSYMKSCLMLK